jgi:copper chaperone CopZ
MGGRVVAPTLEEHMETIESTLAVEGMTCQHCVHHVTTALKKVAGVAEVRVSLKDGRAVVSHAAGVALPTMIEAVAEAGYSARAS